VYLLYPDILHPDPTLAIEPMGDAKASGRRKAAGQIIQQPGL
jgi:hypothetical protein